MTEKVGKIEVVIKGGQPWGFQLEANSENRSTLTIIEIFPGGKADLQGELKVGDNVIKINGIQCLSLEDALQLIDSAFRTLTVLVWRPSHSSKDLNCLTEKAFNPCFQKLNEKSISSNRYPPPFRIYENLENISRGVGNSCIETFSQINATNCKDIFVSSSAGSKNTNDVQEMKTIFEYIPQHLMYSNVHSKADLEVKSETESYSDEKWKCLSISKGKKHNLSSISSQNLSTSFDENYHNSCKENYVPTVKIQENDYVFHRSVNKHFSVNSRKSNKINSKVSTKTIGCMYPNCQNQYQICKVHSPPERDTVNPISNSYEYCVGNQLISQSLSHSPLKYDQLNYENLEFLNTHSLSKSDQMNYENLEFLNNSHSPLKYDQMNYENVECLNNSSGNKDIKNVKTTSCANELSASNIPLSIHSKVQLMKKKSYSNPAYENCFKSYVKTASLPDDSFSKVNYENIPRRDVHSLSQTRIAFEDVHQDILNQPNFISSDAKQFINNTLYMFCNKSSINSTTLTNPSEVHPVHDRDNLDEELIEIEKNFEKSLHFSDCQTPPLPSPPPDHGTEILETDEPLPPPPFTSDVNAAQNVPEDTNIIQTIYANVEMLKIQCSVVSSSTQTTLQLNKKPTVKDFSKLELGMSVQKTPQDEKGILPQIQEKCREAKSLQTQFHNYSSLMKKTVQKQEKKLSKNTLNLPITSAYFTTSVPKAKLLTQYTSTFENKNMTFVKELSNEKEELLESIAKKLRVLKQEEAALQEELKQNEELGSNLANKLEELANKSETQKFKLHVEELEKITNLLLSLSGRLARTENALLILPAESSEEKELLEAKYSKLTQQYDEAVNLQRNIEKRNNQVSLCLYKYLTQDDLVDYDHFIHMKVKLLIDYKDLLEKIKLGEEQLYALKTSFNTSDNNEIKRDL